MRQLVTADKRRGLATRLIYLDGAGLSRNASRIPPIPAENKAAVDAVARRHRPEYLVILGSRDVAPPRI